MFKEQFKNKIKNTEPRPKFPGSYKKRVYHKYTFLDDTELNMLQTMGLLSRQIPLDTEQELINAFKVIRLTAKNNYF